MHPPSPITPRCMNHADPQQRSQEISPMRRSKPKSAHFHKHKAFCKLAWKRGGHKDEGMNSRCNFQHHDKADEKAGCQLT